MTKETKDLLILVFRLLPPLSPDNDSLSKVIGELSVSLEKERHREEKLYQAILGTMQALYLSCPNTSPTVQRRLEYLEHVLKSAALLDPSAVSMRDLTESLKTALGVRNGQISTTRLDERLEEAITTVRLQLRKEDGGMKDVY